MTTSAHPHVDKAWHDDFIVEARVLGYTGAAIGAALAEVESHCASSGESASEAFGDATAYANSLDLPKVGGTLGKVVLGALVSLVGLNFAPGAALALTKGTDMQVGLGQLLGLGVVAAASVALAWNGGAVVRFLLRRRSAAFATVFGVVVVLACVATVTLTSPAFAMPAALAVAVAAVALLVGAVITWRAFGPDEPVADPFAPRRGSGIAGRVLVTAMVPTFAIVLALLRVLVG